MLGKLIDFDITELIDEGNLNELKMALGDLPSANLAEILSEVDPKKAIVVFRILPRDKAGNVFADLNREKQEELLQSFSQERLVAILENMPPDDRTQLFEELPGKVTQRLMNLLSADQLRMATQLLGYPEDSVGRLMTPHYIMVKPHWSVETALRHIRSFYSSAETASVVYVVDKDLKLVDDLKLAQIVVASPNQKIGDLMDWNFVALRVDEDQEEAIGVFKKYYRFALPVVDSDGVLVGIVTLDDILAVAEEEATEDIHKIGGMESLDEPYASTPFWTLIRKRAGWLLVLFLSEMLTATAMGRFEEEIARAVVLALFVPLIISSGGNSGAQAASLIIRALAIGEISVKDWWRVMRREILSGLVLGFILGVVGFLRISIWSFFSDTYGPHWLLVGVTIWISLIGVVLWGTLSGSLLPLLLKKIGLDPAVSSAPFVATLVDVTGIVIYFEVAAIVLHGALL